jgi:hypothetical protein
MFNIKKQNNQSIGSVWKRSFGDTNFRVLKQTNTDGTVRYLQEVSSPRMQRPKITNYGNNMNYAISQSTNWLNGLAVRKQMSKKYANERKEGGKNLNVGDIMHSSWGYDQTNNDFYQIVDKQKSFVFLRPIGTDLKQTGFMSGEVRPIKDKFLDKDNLTKEQILKRRASDYVKIDDTRSATKWKGGTAYSSWYA